MFLRYRYSNIKIIKRSLKKKDESKKIRSKKKEKRNNKDNDDLENNL